MIITLMVIAVALTATMFATRMAMLGFPSAMFWAILGTQAYTMSTTPWGDIYYFLFFASSFGMTIFCAIAAWGLRESRDTFAEEEMERGKDVKYFDEIDEPNLNGNMGKTSRRKALHNRAEKRRQGGTKKKSEFDF